MILTLDYEELNNIIKCYVTETLNLEPASDTDIVCSNTDYGQSVTAQLLINYKDCNVDDGDDGDLNNDDLFEGS